MLDPVVQALVFLSTYLGNLGWAVIVFTLVIKVALYPINKSAIKSALKLKSVQPEQEALQKKYSKDPKKLQKAQLELYQKAGVNPLGGCLPQLVQLAVVIVLYRSLISLLGHESVESGLIVTKFLWLDLRHPDSFYILPLLAAISQFAVTHLMMGGKEVKKNEKKSKQEASSTTASSMAIMQKQMVYVMPVMTGVIAASFPAGISLYWVVSTIFSLFQQWQMMNKTQRLQALEPLKNITKGIGLLK